MFVADKVYDAHILLGVTTTTGDAEGEVVSSQPVSAQPDDVAAVLQKFLGVIAQAPPMHSALKRHGKPLYEYARRGEKVELQPRPVRIHAIHFGGLDGAALRCRIECGSGTYIRVLAEDVGPARGGG